MPYAADPPIPSLRPRQPVPESAIPLPPERVKGRLASKIENPIIYFLILLLATYMFFLCCINAVFASDVNKHRSNVSGILSHPAWAYGLMVTNSLAVVFFALVWFWALFAFIFSLRGNKELERRMSGAFHDGAAAAQASAASRESDSGPYPSSLTYVRDPYRPNLFTDSANESRRFICDPESRRHRARDSAVRFGRTLWGRPTDELVA